MPRKRLASKANSTLRKKADAAWLLFWAGIDEKVFGSYAEGKAAWQLVKNWYMENHPFHCEKRNMDYGPAGYWLYEVPGAPFTYPQIPGLDDSDCRDYFKRKILIELRIWPAGCYDPMIDEAESVQAAIAAGISSLPFPLHTPDKERQARWKALLAKHKALVKLGYIKAK